MREREREGGRGREGERDSLVAREKSNIFERVIVYPLGFKPDRA